MFLELGAEGQPNILNNKITKGNKASINIEAMITFI